MVKRNDERRKSERLERHFVVAYRLYEGESDYDLSQIKNISKGGLRFITSKQYTSGAILAIELRTPVSTGKIKLQGKVIASDVVVDGMIYDTRVAYVSIDKDTEMLVSKTIQYFSENQKRKGYLEE